MFKNNLIKILFNTLMIMLPSVVLGFALAKNNWVLAGIMFLVSFVFIISLYALINQLNNKIAFFFEAVENDDSSLNFQENVKGSSFKRLNQALNRVNLMIQEIRKTIQVREEYYKTMIDHAATGLLTFDGDEKIREINSAAQKMLGIYNPYKISQLGRNDARIPELIRNLKDDRSRVLRVKSENEVQQLFFQVKQIKKQEGELKLLSIENIKNEMDRNELDSWVKLIRVLSHEIMNSIAPITSMASTLQEMYTKEGKRIKSDECSEELMDSTINALEVILEQGEGLISFVRSYRQLTHLPEPNLQLFRADRLFKRIRLLIEQYPDALGVEIKSSVMPSHLEILADEQLISQVVLNICINGLHAMKENQGEKLLSIETSLTDSGNTRIIIRDTGCGMPREIRDKVFIPFYTTKPEGAGIGLSLARQVMYSHKGDIQIETAPGEGTAVILKF